MYVCVCVHANAYKALKFSRHWTWKSVILLDYSIFLIYYFFSENVAILNAFIELFQYETFYVFRRFILAIIL